MPCLPGPCPVIKETHAGGVTGGTEDIMSPHAPVLINFAKLGNLPFFMSGNITANVPPSIPITITFLLFINITIYKKMLFCIC
jgi:hypothetical protein